MSRFAAFNPFATGWLLVWQAAVALAFVPLAGMPLILQLRYEWRGEGTPPTLTHLPLFLLVISTANTLIAVRRAGGTWGWSAAVAALAGALAALLVWLVVFWTRLVGGTGWSGLTLVSAMLLLYINLGGPKWAASPKALEPSEI